MGIPTYNGETTNLTGQGSPNPVKLTLPMLDQVQDPAVQTALLRILQFVNNLVAPSSGGGGYASLTGAGETTTPGALTQLGPFTVTDTDTSHGITFTTTGSTFVAESINGANNSTLTLNGGAGTLAATVTATVSAPTVNITGSVGVVIAGKGVTIKGIGSPANVGICRSSSDTLTFFQTGGALQRTVTGSRGGNAALASLLTGLAAYGLIIDSST